MSLQGLRRRRGHLPSTRGCHRLWRYAAVTYGLALALASRPVNASGFGGAPLPGGGQKMFDGAFGFGPELGFLGRGSRADSDIALSADLVLIAAEVPTRYRCGPPPPTRDRANAALRGEASAPRCRRDRALLARIHAEVHVGVVAPITGESGAQLRVSLGSGLGLPVTFGAAYATEGDSDGAHSVGPELRLRHFFGDGADSASLGLLARAEIFANRRDEYSDRLVLGIHGAFDLISVFD